MQTKMSLQMDVLSPQQVPPLVSCILVVSPVMTSIAVPSAGVPGAAAAAAPPQQQRRQRLQRRLRAQLPLPPLHRLNCQHECALLEFCCWSDMELMCGNDYANHVFLLLD